MNIIIFGATGGIGSALTDELLIDNNLFLGSRSEDKISETIKSKRKLGHNLDGLALDMNSFESINLFIKEAHEFLGSIDAIINCVGSLLLKPSHLLSEEEIYNVFKVNVFSCFAIMKYSFKFLKDNGGSIIFFSSSASKIGLKNHDAISSAKAAVSAMALSSASTYAKYNIRINTIAPGLVDTPLTKRITGNKASLDYSKEMHGLKRIGTAQNFIPIINSLIDKRSDWITGQTFFIDGGLSNVK